MIKRHSLVATPVLFLALLVVHTPAGVGSVPARAGVTRDQTVANSPRQPAAATVPQGKTVLLDVPDIAERSTGRGQRSIALRSG